MDFCVLSRNIFRGENTVSIEGTLTDDGVGRQASVQDARGNRKDYGYDAEGRLATIDYTLAPGNPSNTQPTPNVILSYEPAYGRLATVLDGTGTTTGYTYVPIDPTDGILGDGALESETKIVGGGIQYTHSYTYDELGRTKSGPRQISADWDPLGRLTGMTSGLGAFTFGYEAKSGRLSTVDAALTDATVAALRTSFTYEEPDAGEIGVRQQILTGE